MKRLAFALVVFFTFFGALQAADKSKGEIKFEKTLYDFGNIREDGGPVTHVFKFTNEGSEDLTITNAKAECGCTTPTYPKTSIAPGETGEIKVTYNPLGRPGGFTKVVTVRCTGHPGKVNLKIRGSVIPK